MRDNSIYESIARRTGGDIYIGVVGPVRTGKSTFIRRFLDCVVLPNIKDENDRARAQDEMPQSASGRLIMTTEPKFVPDEAVAVSIGGGTEFSVKMIDCVGYMVDGALGGEEDGVPRMVRTPWSDDPIPFSLAAEMGTSKVIREHSTIGILVTTDGTIGDIPREGYIEAEERVAKELKALGKPYAIILNSANPGSKEAIALAEELEGKYGVPVALVSCPDLTSDDIAEILGLVLGQFPIKRLDFHIPDWCELLSDEHPVNVGLNERVREMAEGARKLGDIETMTTGRDDAVLVSIDAGEGVGEIDLPISDEEYYRVIEEATGLSAGDKKRLFAYMRELAEIREKYEKIRSALEDVEDTGYGIVMPTVDEVELEEPRMVKTQGGFGVELVAHANSIHMIRTDIRAELCPMVATEEQAEEVVRHLASEYERDKDGIWESNMFGKSLYDLVNDGLVAKLENMPSEARRKLGDTLERIINEGAAGLLCILL